MAAVANAVLLGHDEFMKQMDCECVCQFITYLFAKLEMVDWSQLFNLAGFAVLLDRDESAGTARSPNRNLLVYVPILNSDEELGTNRAETLTDTEEPIPPFHAT